jgi:carbon-monoxide dehydrogenase medium subunit
VIASTRGTRRLPVAEFITGVKATALGPDELVERIVIPKTMIDSRGGYKKLKRIKGHDLGVVSAALLKHGDILRIALSSAAPTPVLLPDFPSTEEAGEVQRTAQSMIRPIDDVRCTAEYRSFMVNVFIERLMEEVSR